MTAVDKARGGGSKYLIDAPCVKVHGGDVLAKQC